MAPILSLLLLVTLGDVLDPILFGEAGLEVGLFDLGAEFSVLGLHHAPLLALVLAGGTLMAAVSVLEVRGTQAIKVLRATPTGMPGKVPI